MALSWAATTRVKMSHLDGASGAYSRRSSGRPSSEISGSSPDGDAAVLMAFSSAMPVPVPYLGQPSAPPASFGVSNGAADSESEDDGKSHKDGPEKKKRKRNRVALSCVQCKRRKVKCSRTSPCEACIRHGCADECKWEEGAAAEQSNPFAMQADLTRLQSRYSVLERYVVDKLAVNSGELASLLAQVESPPPSQLETVRRSTSGVPVPSLFDNTASHRSKEKDVAAVLEELAMGPPAAYHNRSPATHLKPQQALTTIMLSQSIEDSEVLAFIPPHELYSRLFTSLPSDDVVISLIRSNCNALSFVGVHHMPTILAETHEFLEARRRNDMAFVDPAWLAFFLTLLCSGLHDLGDFVPYVAGIPFRELKKLAPFWLSAARAALNLSGYFEQPQFRAIQTIVQFIHLSVVPFNRARQKGPGVWLAAAIRIAQTMGYHELGSDEELMPPDDPGLPAIACGLKRQLAVRIWNHLYSYDTILSHSPPVRFILEKDDFNTALPAYVNDEQLGAEVHVVEQPPTVDTAGGQAAYKVRMMEMFRLALHTVRQAVNLPDDQGAQRALELDRMFRKEIDATSGTMSTRRKHNIVSGLMARILRVHRPFAQKAYEGDRSFEASMWAYLECAYAICHANRDADIHSDYVFLPRHVIMATIALFQHRFAMIAQGTPERQEIETNNALNIAANTFVAYQTHKFADLRNTADNGLNIITKMREAEAVYRQNPRADTFISIVERVAKAQKGEAPSSLQISRPATDRPLSTASTTSDVPDMTPYSRSGDNASPLTSNVDPLLGLSVGGLDGIGGTEGEIDWSALLQGDVGIF